MSDYPRCKNCAWFRAGWVWIPTQRFAICRNPKTFPSEGSSRYHLGKSPRRPTPNTCSSARGYGECGPEGKLFVRAEAIGTRFTRFRRWLPTGWNWLWAVAWAIVFVILLGGYL